MIKRFFLGVALLAAAVLAGCGGGGAGSSSTPGGVNPGVASIIQLLTTVQVAQTNSQITLKAKVLNGNGNVMPGVQVIFTNLSPIGVLSATTAMTDGLGYATVRLFSSDSGFSTIQAEVPAADGRIRDKKTVFFSIFDLTIPTGAEGTPTLTLDVDSNNNGIFNESVDFTLLDGPGNNQSIIRATVKDSSGNPVVNDAVTFTADSTDATFPGGSDVNAPVVHTDGNGQASVMMQVDPTTLTALTRVLNVAASAESGPANVVSFFLEPVSVQTVTIFANPKEVNSAGSSQITADVTTSAGTPAPDGTTVNFTATGGAIPPFAQTTDGQVTQSWTAPTVAEGVVVNHNVTAATGGKSATVQIKVSGPVPAPPTPAPLRIVPTTVAAVPNSVLSFTISGGTGPYTTTSSDINRAFNDDGAGGGTANNGIRDGGELGQWSDTPISVTVPATATAGSVTLTVADSAGGTVTATINVQ